MQVPEGYFAILFEEPDSGMVGVRFPEHPGVITYGHDWDEAEEMAQEALSAALETDFERDVELPAALQHTPEPSERVVFIPLEPEIPDGIPASQLARRGRTHPEGNGSEDGHQRPGLPTNGAAWTLQSNRQHAQPRCSGSRPQSRSGTSIAHQSL